MGCRRWSACLAPVFLQAPQDVLDAHHRVVHQAADGDGEAAQGHGVDRHAEILEHQRGHEDRHRDGGERDHGRAQGAQEEEQDHRDEHRGADQLALQGVDGGLDEAGLAEGDAGFGHARRQALLQCDQGVLDGPGQRDGVRRGLLLDAQDHRRPALEAGVAALGGRGEGHLGDLAQQDGLVVAAGQRQVLQVFQARGAAQVADQVFPAVEFQEAARGVGREAAQGIVELVVGDAQFRHAHGIRLHLELAHLAADGNDLGDAGDRHQARPEHPVGVFPHRHRRNLSLCRWEWRSA